MKFDIMDRLGLGVAIGGITISMSTAIQVLQVVSLVAAIVASASVAWKNFRK